MDSGTGVTLTKYAADPTNPSKGTLASRKKRTGPPNGGSTKPSKLEDQDGGEDDDDKVRLKRTLGLGSGASLIIGSMIGSGIFISPQGVTRGAGSVGMSMVVWIVSGFVSTLGALCFAEMGTMMPVSGAEYSYINDFYGDCAGFLIAWLYVLLMQPAGTAIISLTCSSYILTPMFNDGCGRPPEYLAKALAAALIMLLTGINCYSVKLATRIQVTFTVAKVIALFIIIIGGLIWLLQGKTEHLEVGFKGTETDPGKIVLAFYSCFWSYGGWSNLNTVTEEVKNPSKTLPLSIFLGLSTVIVVYLLTNLSYYTVLSIDEMLEAPAVGVSWAEYVIPGIAWIIPLSVALSTFGTTIGGVFMTGRVCYVMGRNGHMLKLLGMVHVDRFTPFPAIAFSSFLAIVYLIPGDIGTLLNFVSFVGWAIQAVLMLQIVIMKFTHKHLDRPFSVNICVPIALCVFSVGLVLVPLVTDPQIGYFAAIGIMFLGLLFYIPVIYCKHYPPGLDTFTTACQQLMKVSPPQLGEVELPAQEVFVDK